jgi:hypothetical protein
MEAEGRNIDFFTCPLVGSMSATLTAAEQLIQLPVSDAPVSLRAWKDQRMDGGVKDTPD